MNSRVAHFHDTQSRLSWICVNRQCRFFGTKGYIIFLDSSLSKWPYFQASLMNVFTCMRGALKSIVTSLVTVFLSFNTMNDQHIPRDIFFSVALERVCNGKPKCLRIRAEDNHRAEGRQPAMLDSFCDPKILVYEGRQDNTSYS